MASNSLELFREWFDENPSEDLRSRFVSMPIDQAHQFADQYLQIDGTHDLPPLAPGKLRPYVSLNRPLDGWADMTASSVARLNLVCLYAHEAAVPDPINVWIREVGSKPNREHDDEEYSRAILNAVFSRLLAVQPLVDVNVVHLYRDMAKYNLSPAVEARAAGEESFISRRVVGLALGSHDPVFTEVRDTISQNIIGPAGAEGGTRVLLQELWKAVNECSRSGGTCQLLLRGEADTRLISWMLEGSTPSRPREGARLEALLKLGLASPETMDSRRVAELRMESASFTEWRLVLQRALEEILTLDEEQNWQPAARVVMTEYMEPVQAKLLNEVKKSRALQQSFVLGKGLVVSCLAVGASMAVGGNPVEATATGTATLFGQLLLDYAQTVERRRRDRTGLDIVMSLTQQAEAP